MKELKEWETYLIEIYLILYLLILFNFLEELLIIFILLNLLILESLISFLFFSFPFSFFSSFNISHFFIFFFLDVLEFPISLLLSFSEFGIVFFYDNQIRVLLLVELFDLIHFCHVESFQIVSKNSVKMFQMHAQVCFDYKSLLIHTEILFPHDFNLNHVEFLS